MNLTVGKELKKKQDSTDLWAGIVGKRKAILKLLAGGEYNVKAVCESFNIPNPYDEGKLSEYEAIEEMRVDAIVTLCEATGSEVDTAYKWLCDEAYIMF